MTGETVWALVALGIPFLLGVAVGIEIRRRKPVVEQVIVEIQRDVPDVMGEAVRKGIERIVSGQQFMGAEMVGALTIPLKAEGRPSLFLIIATADLAAKYERACGK